MVDEISSSEAGRGGSSSRAWCEKTWLIGGLAIFLLVNCFTAERSPAVWSDEVMYQDPGVNLYQGHGWTSAAWWLQPRDQFWAGNVPLYQFVVYGWLKIFGFSLWTVRCLHYVLTAAAVWVGWLAIRRLNLIPKPQHRLMFCLVASLCTATTFVYRYARPESLGMLLVALAFLSLSIRPRPLSLLLLVVCGTLMTGMGLQMAAYMAAMSGLVLVLGPRKLLPEMAALCAGCALGGFLVWLFYSQHGVWKEFVESVQHHTIANKGTDYMGATAYGKGFRDKVRKLPELYNDYSLAPMFAFALWMAWGLRRANLLRWSSPLVFGIAACVLVPLGLHTVGIFPMYYFWMNFLPLVLGVCMELGRWQELQHGKLASVVLVVCIGLACLMGLPRRLAVASLDWNARSYEPVMKLAEPYVASDKLILCDFAAYYAAKQHGAEVMVMPDYFRLLTADDKARISAVIAHESDPAWLGTNFGGTWREAAALNPSTATKVHEHLDSREYRLRVYVREEEKLKIKN